MLKGVCVEISDSGLFKESRYCGNPEIPWNIIDNSHVNESCNLVQHPITIKLPKTKPGSTRWLSPDSVEYIWILWFSEKLHYSNFIIEVCCRFTIHKFVMVLLIK